MNMISRRSFLAAAGVSAAALALTACGGSSNSTAASTSTAASAAPAGDAAAAANDPEVTLVYAEVNPLDTIVGQTASHFKEKVEELTGGSVVIDVQASGVWVLRTTFWTPSWAAPLPSTSAVSLLSH